MNPDVRLNRNHELKAGRYGYLAVHNGWPGDPVKYFTPEPSLGIREGQACFDT